MVNEKPKLPGIRVQLRDAQNGQIVLKTITMYGWTAKEVSKLLSDAYDSQPKQIVVQTAPEAN